MTISGAVLAGTTAGAQANDAGRQLTGTWLVTVQPVNGPSSESFESTIVYTATGSVLEATSKAPASAGLGTWERLGAGRYTTTFEKYRFNGSTYVGKTRIEETQEISADGAEYVGRSTTTVLSPSDQVVATFQSTATATRI